MKCPYCGTEMETGYVQSMKEIIYSTNLHTSRIMIPKKDDIKLTYDPWSPASCRAKNLQFIFILRETPNRRTAIVPLVVTNTI